MKKIKIWTFIVIFIMQIFLPTVESTKAITVETQEDETVENVNSDEDESIIYSEAYLNWLSLSDEEKQNVIKPREEFIAFTELEKTVKASDIPDSYNLNDYIDIKVEDQGENGTCYAFSTLNSLETNIMLNQNKEYDFSEMHVEYMTSTLLGGNREFNEGGNFKDVISYSQELLGPVLESDIPNRLYTEEEYETLINTKPVITIEETVEFPTIEQDKSTYTSSELKEFRDSVKTHIMANGSVFAMIYFSESTIYYDSSTYGYSARNTSFDPNHGVSIIGWNDNYKKENFPEYNRPDGDGAWIALNSYGESFGNNGIFYISYEDAWVEYNMSGIKSTKEFGEDIYGPQVEIQNYLDENNTISMTVNVADIGGSGLDLDNLKYQWTNSSEVPSKTSFVNVLSNGEKLSKTYITGEKWYLWILAMDKKGNYVITSDHEWDISKSGYRNVIAKLDEYGVLTISGNGEMKDWLPTGTTIDSTTDPGTPWFFKKDEIKEVIIEEGVTSVGWFAFLNNTYITKVTIPSSMADIRMFAFADCTSLKSISVLSNVKTIETWAFAWCENLTDITILEKDVHLDDEVFKNCENLTIHCKSGSTVEQYAKSHNIKYKIIEEIAIIEENGIKYVTKINPATAVTYIIEELDISKDSKVYTGEEIISDANKQVVTGMKIISGDKEYIIVVKGDTNGDGEADIRDILAINKHRLNKTKLEGEYLKAADVTKDGISNIMDILQINKYRLGKIEKL